MKKLVQFKKENRKSYSFLVKSFENFYEIKVYKSCVDDKLVEMSKNNPNDWWWVECEPVDSRYPNGYLIIKNYNKQVEKEDVKEDVKEELSEAIEFKYNEEKIAVIKQFACRWDKVKKVWFVKPSDKNKIKSMLREVDAKIEKEKEELKKEKEKLVEEVELTVVRDETAIDGEFVDAVISFNADKTKNTLNYFVKDLINFGMLYKINKKEEGNLVVNNKSYKYFKLNIFVNPESKKEIEERRKVFYMRDGYNFNVFLKDLEKFKSYVKSL